MKYILFFCSAMAAMHFLACTSGSLTPEQHSTPVLDSLLADTALLGEDAVVPTDTVEEAVPGNVKPAKIKLANDLDYSADFLKKLTYAGLAENFELADSFIVLEQTDTFVFPMLLPLATMGKAAKWTNFVASKQGYLYSLDVSMANYTTLDFNFELRKNRQTVDQIRGKADLNPGFLLGSESDDDEATGNSYFASEYHFEGQECTFSIRIGEDEGVKKVKLIKLCKSGKFNINLENCPVLLEK
ncbi:MAG: hypothetical protein IPN76_25830 [Saprospiraceae bacterium]|nr:hypothetical protein [Saprospiraceae bacterium]